MPYWTAVARDGDDRPLREGNLHPKGGGETETECSLVAAGHERARLVDGKAEHGGEPHLGDLLDEEAITWQHVADDSEVIHLRLHGANSDGRLLLRGGDLVVSPLRRTVPCQGRGECARSGSSVPDNTNGRRQSAHFRGINIDTDDLQTRRAMAPAHIQQLEAGADHDRDIRFWPQALARRDGEPEGMVVGHDAAAAAEGHRR